MEAIASRLLQLHSAPCLDWGGETQSSRVFKLILFLPQAELRFKNKQNKIETKIALAACNGVWGFGACQDEFVNLQKQIAGARRSEGAAMSALNRC